MSMTIASESPPLRLDETGTWRVGETRVTLESIIYSFLQGSAAEQIVYQYPAVDLVQVYAVIAYYLRHQSEVNDYLSSQKKDFEELRRQSEQTWDVAGLRARIMARKG